MADKKSNFRYDLQMFGVQRLDPGSIYIFRNKNLLKVGMTTDPKRRIREAKTWIPNIEIIAIKPFWNVTHIERTLHEGCAPYWYGGEWFEFDNDDDYNLLIDGFLEFYDEDPDCNSVDFIYWWNSSGFAEFSRERRIQDVSLKKWKMCKAYP